VLKSGVAVGAEVVVRKRRMCVMVKSSGSKAGAIELGAELRGLAMLMLDWREPT